MNTDITFCGNKSCKIRQYCKRGVDIRDSDLLIMYDNFNCMNNDDFFIDLKLPVVVYETNPRDVIEFAQWVSKNYQQTGWTNLWVYFDTSEQLTTEELYKIYKDERRK